MPAPRKVPILHWGSLGLLAISALTILLLCNGAAASAAPYPEPPVPQDADAPDCAPPRPAIECVEATIDGRLTNTSPLQTTPGTPLEWEVMIANRGNVGLEDVAVTVESDAPGSDDIVISCPGTHISVDQSMTCTAQGIARETGGTTHDIQFIVSGRGDDSRERIEDETAACLVRYRTLTCRPGIDLEQYTNYFDADTEPGPYIAPGDPVTWTFVVRNTGNQPLTDVRIADSELGDICTLELLEVGASASCELEGIAQPGLFANVSSVTAEASGCDATVTDTDPCHYFNCTVDIEKTTNGEDADQPPGPEIVEGEPVTWTYVVSNTGGVTLTDLVVTDDQLGEVCRQAQLAPGADFDCTTNGVSGDSITPETAQYANLATVQGYAWSALCTDSDPSHYLPVVDEVQALIALEKDPLPWTYIVTNTGELSLVDVVLTSDVPVEGPRSCADTAADTVLPPGGVWCYDGSAPTRDGYGGAANVAARSTPGELPVFDSLTRIPYAGLTLQLYLDDQEVLPDDTPSIPADAAVTWRYVISNSTEFDLSTLQLWHTSMVKDATYALVCAPPFLGAGESIECTHTEMPMLGTFRIIGSVKAAATLDNVVELLSTDILRRYDGTPPVTPGNIAGRVFHDFLPANGIQDALEPGIEGVTVTLYNTAGEPVATTATDISGRYLFTALPGNYRVHVAAANGSLCSPDKTNNNCLDSDVDPADGLTPEITVRDGATERCWDAGIVTPRLLLPLVER